MRYALVDDTNTVINLILWDGTTEWIVPSDCQLVQSDTLQIGDTYS